MKASVVGVAWVTHASGIFHRRFLGSPPNEMMNAMVGMAAMRRSCTHAAREALGQSIAVSSPYALPIEGT